jgi:hypothetical protein
VDHEHPREDRSRRVCRFCQNDVETPEHALFSCDSSPEAVSLRAIFLENLFTTAPSLRRRLDDENSIDFFKSVLYERPTVALLAKFAHEVLEIFYATPLFRMG